MSVFPGDYTTHELRSPSGTLIAWLQARPPHCDRGRFHAGVEVDFWRSENDWWPRYYFDLERGKLELMEYLKAKKVNVDGAAWVAVDYRHKCDHSSGEWEGDGSYWCGLCGKIVPEKAKSPDEML